MRGLRGVCSIPVLNRKAEQSPPWFNRISAIIDLLVAFEQLPSVSKLSS